MNTTYQAILSALPKHFHTLLNVECKDGELISLIAEKFKADLIGVDTNEESIKTARSRNISNAEFFAGNHFSLLFKMESLM